MRFRIPSRLLALVAGLCSLALVGAAPLPAGALPVTTLTRFVALPAGAVVMDAAMSPSRGTLAVTYSVQNAGDNELWVAVRRSGAWAQPVRLSEPGTSAYNSGLDVGPFGDVVVAWVEQSDLPDVIVVRSVGADGAGDRRIISVDPYNSVHVASGNGETVVVWDQFFNTRQRVRAARAIGDGAFAAPEWVNPDDPNRSAAVTDVSAYSGAHVTLRMRGTVGGGGSAFYYTGWALHQPDGWHFFELSQSLVDNRPAVPSPVAVGASGNALILHGHDVDGSLQPKVTMFNADPALVLEPDAELDARLASPVAVGSPGSGIFEAILAGDQLVGLLNDAVATATVVSAGGTSADVVQAPEVCGTNWVLTESLDFVCYLLPDPFGSQVDLIDGDGNELGSMTPSDGATQVTARSIRASVPVLVVKEVRPGPDPQWLLDFGPGDVIEEPPPPPPAPTTFTQVKPAKVTGKLKVGKTLTAKPGTWTPAPTEVDYRWFANGKKIKKATKPKLRLVKALKGKKISVRITLTRPSITTKTVKVTRPGKVR